MDAETFNDLALRTLAGEVTEDERQALTATMASDPARADHFRQLKITHDVLRVTVPMIEAVSAHEPGLPAHRVGQLRTAVHQHFGPVVGRRKTLAPFGKWSSAFRWIFAGSGTAAMGYAIVIFVFANRTIEVGLYGTDLVRGGEQGITAADIPDARLVTFDRDASFDQWQNEALAWNERAKIWIDNEHDLLHFTHRVRHGQTITETLPLPAGTTAQRDQIKRIVTSLKN